jgi:sugar-phosphatase
MDGLLIDSEPLWREAEIAVFDSVGLRLTDAMCRETTGLRIDEVVRHWHTRFPWNGPGCAAIAKQVLDAVERLIVKRGCLMEGAQETIEAVHARNVKLAIASSSPMRLIRVVVETFALNDYFSVLHSAEHETAGKPDPAVYQTTMALLEAEPHECIAFEDSVPGVRAAKQAGATVIAVPAPADAGQPGFALADLTLASLADFRLEMIETK